MKQEQLSLHKKFSHIYVEEAAKEYEDTQIVLARFPKAKVIAIENYKEILNRSRQNWRAQKGAQSIILAKRNDEFLYKGTDIAPNFSHKHFYYNTLALNCLYNCHYCYLQGMYPSAHTVLFVNHNDYFAATEAKLGELGSMYLCISYDTDLLAFENILPQCKRWISFAASHPDLIIELRTKSTNISALKEAEPTPNVVLAWTLSPHEIVTTYEEQTPPVEQRLNALREMATRGWKIRICIDPVLVVDNWHQQYKTLIDQIFSTLSPEHIADITIGGFRMPERFFKETKKIRHDSPLLHGAFQKDHSIIRYNTSLESEIKDIVCTYLYGYYPEERVELVL